MEDIDSSWHLREKRGSGLSTFLSTKSKMRIYYSVRNRVIFERKNLVTKPGIYYINIFLYKFLLEIFRNFFRDKENVDRNLKIFNKAVKDGLEGVVGKNENFNI